VLSSWIITFFVQERGFPIPTATTFGLGFAGMRMFGNVCGDTSCALFWLPLIKNLPLDMDNLPKIIMKERASKASSSGND